MSRFANHFVQQRAGDPTPAVLQMNCNVVNVNGVGQQPEQDVANGPVPKLSQNGPGAGHLELLEKKPSAPGKTK